jgi:hypothetical protein
MPAFLETAGECMSIECALPWVEELVAEGAAGELSRHAPRTPSVVVRVERSHEPFAVAGWEPFTRGAWRRDGEVVVENACTAGFDVHGRCAPDVVALTYRWRPPARDRIAARALRSRFHLLARAVLTQFPALWWSGTRGRVPLHASACVAGQAIPLLASAGGVGRSTLLLRELAARGSATGDNLAVGDGRVVWGLVEPLRIEGGGGRRMPHGREELRMAARVPSLTPDRLVLLERDVSSRSSLSRCTPDVAARALTAATYMAGELRRYWPFAATLAAGTGVGPAHPDVSLVSSAFATWLPCFSLRLGEGAETQLSQVLTTLEEAA